MAAREMLSGCGQRLFHKEDDVLAKFEVLGFTESLIDQESEVL
jgi:hypothetical protein